MKLLSIVSFGLAFFCFLTSAYLVWQRFNPNKLAFATEPAKISTSAQVRATRLVISDLQIDLPIVEADISGRSWATTDLGVSHLSSTPAPGETGNSILYGHNYQNLLGELPKIKPGSKIEILLRDGSWRTFKVVTTQEVEPTEVEILAQSKKPMLTIFTCSGFLDLKRFVVVAVRV